MNSHLKRRTLLATMAATPLVMAGCSKSDSAAPAADPDALQIYSSQHQNLTEAWAAAFTAKTGIKAQVRAGKDASMGHQIVQEGDKSPADVFLTENSPAMTLVQRAGLLAPVAAATLAQVPDTMAPSSKDWIAIAARSTVLAWNPTKLTKAQLPVSMMDLADASWKDRWGCAAGGADFQAIVAGMLADRGEAETVVWLKALQSGAKVFQNNVATMKAVNAGEVPLGIIYHYYWYRDQAGDKAGSNNVQLHYFGHKDPGAFVSLSAGGVLKSSSKPDQAQQFLAWVTSPEGQQELVTSKSMEYAVGKGVASDPALPPLASLDAPPVDPVTLNSEKVTQLMTDAGIF